MKSLFVMMSLMMTAPAFAALPVKSTRPAARQVAWEPSNKHECARNQQVASLDAPTAFKPKPVESPEPRGTKARR